MKPIKFLMTALMMCFTIASFGQEKLECNIDVKVDSYSGKKTIETKFVKFKGGTYKMEKKDNENIYLWIQFESLVHLTIDAGEILYIKFTDGTVIQFIITTRDFGDYSTYGYTNSFSFNLSGEKLENLKTKQIQGMKMYINEYNLSNRDSEKFKNNINCVLLTN